MSRILAFSNPMVSKLNRQLRYLSLVLKAGSKVEVSKTTHPLPVVFDLAVVLTDFKCRLNGKLQSRYFDYEMDDLEKELKEERTQLERLRFCFCPEG
jgi:hypothetical protein